MPIDDDEIIEKMFSKPAEDEEEFRCKWCRVPISRLTMPMILRYLAIELENPTESTQKIIKHIKELI